MKSLPDFPAHIQWFNLTDPLDIKPWTLLSFWSYGDAESLVLNDLLNSLYLNYSDHLLVIGVHSPKFLNERTPEGLLAAIERCAIQYPIAQDNELFLAQRYAIHHWPSLLLINAQGQVVARFSGILDTAKIQQDIARYIRATSAMESPTLKRKVFSQPIPTALWMTNKSVYVSDNHTNAVLEIDLKEKKLIRTFGRGQFLYPQGLAYCPTRHQLFVTDTGHHRIQSIDLKSGRIETIFEAQEGFRLPWGLAYQNEALYITAAGSHRIWKFDLKQETGVIWAGSGAEDLLDGSKEKACFAQPLGITCSREGLYVLDSRSSALRYIDYQTEQVTTLIGSGLFEFGQQDGVGRAAQLQHPQSLVYDLGFRVLWITDTYNHIIRKFDISTQTLITLKLNMNLYEPWGITSLGDRICVADTNHHRLVKINPYTGRCVAIALGE